MHRSLVMVIAPAVVGCGIAAYAYFATGTGVTGSEGALLALIGALAVALGGIVASRSASRGLAFGLLAFLIALGAALTAVAAYFLMQFWLVTAMVVTLLGLAVVLLRPARVRRPV